MRKLLGRIRTLVFSRHHNAYRPANDPLSHPDIARMSLREIGDLPFDR